jgi:hypothetical protein
LRLFGSRVLLLEEIMTTFRGNRVVHEFTQTNPAAPEKVFPLLCPVREGDWLPGWKYRLIYCVFSASLRNPGTRASSNAGFKDDER